MTVNETLIEQYLREEMVAERLIEREGDAYVFQGERNTFLIEVRAFNMGARTKSRRLKEEQ